MPINKILYVEDNITKYCDVSEEFKRLGIPEIIRARNAKEAWDAVQNANPPFDLFLFDMHFDYFGENDYSAGKHLMEFLRERGYQTPVIICSTIDYRIPGTVGNIFYHPDRLWEDEAKKLLDKLRRE